MIIQKKGEPRAYYLLRVAAAFIEENPIVQDYLVCYDGATCDGLCLRDDINNELESFDYNLILEKYKNDRKS